MMTKKLQQPQIKIQEKSEQPVLSKWDIYFEYYIDSVLRGLIAFGVSLIVSLLIISFTKIPAWWLLPVAFLLSLLLNPFLSRIHLGKKLRLKFIDYLNRTFKLK